MTLYLISVAVFALFISTIIVINGVPKSVSQSYYVLGDKLLASLFTWFCWLTAMPLLIYWLQFEGKLLAFLACSGLMFVGVAPMFNEKSEKVIHNVSAVVCFLSAYAWMALYGDLSLTMTSVVVLIFINAVAKNKIFWLEITAFITTFIALIS